MNFVKKNSVKINLLRLNDVTLSDLNLGPEKVGTLESTENSYINMNKTQSFKEIRKYLVKNINRYEPWKI